MDRSDLTATSFVTSRLTTLVVVAAGVFYLFQPDWLGWSSMVENVGSVERLNAMGVGVAFVLCASLSFEKNQLRVRVAELVEAGQGLILGGTPAIV